jgi:hypothetical protein
MKFHEKTFKWALFGPIWTFYFFHEIFIKFALGLRRPLSSHVHVLRRCRIWHECHVCEKKIVEIWWKTLKKHSWRQFLARFERLKWKFKILITFAGARKTKFCIIGGPPLSSQHRALKLVQVSMPQNICRNFKNCPISMGIPIATCKISRNLASVGETIERNFQVNGEMRDEIVVCESILIFRA